MKDTEMVSWEHWHWDKRVKIAASGNTIFSHLVLLSSVTENLKLNRCMKTSIMFVRCIMLGRYSSSQYDVDRKGDLQKSEVS